MKQNIKIKPGFLLAMLFPFAIGAIVMLALGYEPLDAYRELLKGAFVGNFNLGTTLEKFCPIFLTALAYCVTSKVRYFNMGVEGCFYLGALCSAGAGFLIRGLPWYIHIPVCFLCGVLAGALWAAIPGALRAYWNVNELCSALLLNYVAIHFANYMIAGPWSAKGASSQTVPIQESAALLRIMKPSRANVGLFMAVFLYAAVFWMFQRTKIGYRLRSTGSNPYFTDYIGVDAKRMVLLAAVLSGAIGGFAGAIQSLGVYGTIIDGFSNNTAFDGMLASLIANNSFVQLPAYSFLIAALKTGALGMERFTGVPKAMIDTLIPMLILLLSMEGLFESRPGRGRARKKLGEKRKEALR